MTDQLHIDFERTHARATDPETSHQAARSVVGVAEAQCAEIRAVLEKHGPQTAESAADHCSLDKVQIGRRFSDLHAAGWIRRNGEKRKIKTGRKACVWELVPDEGVVR